MITVRLDKSTNNLQLITNSNTIKLTHNISTISLKQTGRRGERGEPGEDGERGDNGTNGLGVPTGGDFGQVLAKVSSDDFDTDWVDVSGGGDSYWTQISEDGNDFLQPEYPVALNNTTLYYRQGGDLNHSMGWGYYKHGIDGPVLNGFNGVGFAVGDANDSADILVGRFDEDGAFAWDDSADQLEKLAFESQIPDVSTIEAELLQAIEDGDAATLSSANIYTNSQIGAIDFPVDSVAGKTGTVTLVKGDVGLANVDNTSDAAKPVSTAQQAALDNKVTGTNTITVSLTAPVSPAIGDIWVEA